MKSSFKFFLATTMGAMLLVTNVLGAEKCYSVNDLNDFKKIYIELQQKLNYEAKDAYLDKNFKVQLRPHDKNTPYGGKEFEEALFQEYQNSMRKVGKLYQAAKFESDDNFKSNPLLVNFMAAIDDKKSDSSDFIKKTKVRDVIKALEEASIKKFGNTANKRFVLNAGDKYLLEKLLTHAQDRICSITTFEKTGKDTKLFKADYLQKVQNAPLNRLLATIKSSSIDKDSLIDLKNTPLLTASLVDPNLATKSAVAENLQQLSDWVKKVKGRGKDCLQAIKGKNFTNLIQSNIQSCNFGRMIDTLSEQNVNNLEAVLHYINANERLLNNPVAKAETALNEVKLEGFIGKTFDNLQKEIKCTQLESSKDGDKKVFIRNLPYDSEKNEFQTNGIICKFKGKILASNICKEKYSLVSDSLGRGLELQVKDANKKDLSFSIKESTQCSNIVFDDESNDSDKSEKEKREKIILTKEETIKNQPAKDLEIDPKKNIKKDQVVDNIKDNSKDKDLAKIDQDKADALKLKLDNSLDKSNEKKSDNLSSLKLDQPQCNEKALKNSDNGTKPLVSLFYNKDTNNCDLALTQASCDEVARKEKTLIKDRILASDSSANSSTDPSADSSEKSGTSEALLDKEATATELVLNPEKNICEKKLPSSKVKLTQEKCNDEAVAKTEGGKNLLIELTPDKNGTQCVPKNIEKKTDKNTEEAILSQEKCDDKARLATDNGTKPLIKLFFNKEKNSCDLKDPSIIILTQENCDVMGKDSTERGKFPMVEFILDEKKNECAVKVTQKDCDVMSQDSTERGKLPMVEFVLNAEQTGCNVKNHKSDVKKEDKKEEKKEDNKDKDLSASQKSCIEKNKKWKEENNDTPEDKYSWDEKSKSCVDAFPDEKESEEDGDEKDLKTGIPAGPKRAPPGRFQGISIPGRQPYLMQGMP